MGFQKCPICSGTGIGPGDGLNTTTVCTVCNGQKIINELTGRPPSTSIPIEPKNVFVGPGHKGYYSDYYKGLRENLNKKFLQNKTKDKT